VIGQVYEHVTVDLADGLIHRMTKLSKWPSPGDEALSWTSNEQITIINLQGKFLCPGLIDCHVHLATPPGEDGLKDTMNQDPTTSLLRQPYLAHQMLKRGFTSVRDCGGAGLALKEAFAEGPVPGTTTLHLRPRHLANGRTRRHPQRQGRRVRVLRR